MKNLLTTLWNVLITVILITFVAASLSIICVIWCIYWIVLLLIIAPIIAIADSDDVSEVAYNYYDFIKYVWSAIMKKHSFEKGEEL